MPCPFSPCLGSVRVPASSDIVARNRYGIRTCPHARITTIACLVRIWVPCICPESVQRWSGGGAAGGCCGWRGGTPVIARRSRSPAGWCCPCGPGFPCWFRVPRASRPGTTDEQQDTQPARAVLMPALAATTGGRQTQNRAPTLTVDLTSASRPVDHVSSFAWHPSRSWCIWTRIRQGNAIKGLRSPSGPRPRHLIPARRPGPPPAVRIGHAAHRRQQQMRRRRHACWPDSRRSASSRTACGSADH